MSKCVIAYAFEGYVCVRTFNAKFIILELIKVTVEPSSSEA